MSATSLDYSGGARVVFHHGAPRLLAPAAPPTGAVAAIASVISPGTELRRMRESAQGADHPAGYMNIARRPASGELMLAPEPHGSWMRLDHPRALAAPADTDLRTAAIARFQLISAVGMSQPHFTVPSAALVVGSGPVALGACLELMRRGTEELSLLTPRFEVPFADDLCIRLVRAVPKGAAAVVIDTTGDVERAIAAVAPGGLIGFLGTPARDSAVSGLQLHRRGVTVMGMHELVGYEHPAYQLLYSSVYAWLPRVLNDSGGPARWCTQLPATQVIEHYSRLVATRAGGAGTAPITIVEWP
jgi:hypothetical protein